MGDKCSGCRSCCCRDCKIGNNGSPGYLESFDFFMYKVRNVKPPRYNSKGYLGKKGCKMEVTKRSRVCIFHCCNSFPELRLIVSLWEQIKSEIEFLLDKDSPRMYITCERINRVLDMIENNMAIPIKINKKQLNKSIKTINQLINSKIISDDCKDELRPIHAGLMKLT